MKGATCIRRQLEHATRLLGPVVLLVCCWLMVGASAGQEPGRPIVQNQGIARLRIESAAPSFPKSLHLADAVVVTFEANVDQGRFWTWPENLTTSPGWRVFRQEIHQHGEVRPGQPLPENWIQAKYWLEPLTTGTLALQINPLRHAVGKNPEETGWDKVSWQPVTFQIQPTIDQPGQEPIRDITAIEDLPGTSKQGWLWWMVGGMGIGALAVGILAWRLWGRRETASRSPEEGALRHLDRLLILNLPAQNRIERFHTMLAEILRTFLEKKYQLPARRQTTPEFLTLAAASPQLTVAQRTFLGDFLSRCDLAKFAQAEPTLEHCHGLAEDMRRFIKYEIRNPKNETNTKFKEEKTKP